MKQLRRWLAARWLYNCPPAMWRVIQAARMWAGAWDAQNRSESYRAAFELLDAVNELEQTMGKRLGPRRYER